MHVSQYDTGKCLYPYAISSVYLLLHTARDRMGISWTEDRDASNGICYNKV